MKRFLLFKKIKTLCLAVINDLKEETNFGTFCKKEFKKTN